MMQGFPGLGGFNPQMMQELLRRKQMMNQQPSGINPQMMQQLQRGMSGQMNQRPPQLMPPNLGQQQPPMAPPPVQNQMPVNPFSQGQRLGQQRPGFNPNSRSRFGR